MQTLTVADVAAAGDELFTTRLLLVKQNSTQSFPGVVFVGLPDLGMSLSSTLSHRCILHLSPKVRFIIS